MPNIIGRPFIIDINEQLDRSHNTTKQYMKYITKNSIPFIFLFIFNHKKINIVPTFIYAQAP